MTRGRRWSCWTLQLVTRFSVTRLTASRWCWVMASASRSVDTGSDRCRRSSGVGRLLAAGSPKRPRGTLPTPLGDPEVDPVPPDAKSAPSRRVYTRFGSSQGLGAEAERVRQATGSELHRAEPIRHGENPGPERTIYTPDDPEVDCLHCRAFWGRKSDVSDGARQQVVKSSMDMILSSLWSTPLEPLRQPATASSVAAPLRSLRACVRWLRSTCPLPPPA